MTPAPMPPADPDDPKGLIRESYCIDGITGAECRSILVDWALSLPAGLDARAAMARILAVRMAAPGGTAAETEHPMTTLLRTGLEAADPGTAPSRRGGATGRRGGARYPDGMPKG